MPRIRPADLAGADAGATRRLVRDYLAHTEREKAVQLGDAATDATSRSRYRHEIDHPARAYENATVLLAEIDHTAVGIIVIKHTAEANEIKRVWVDPSARGRRVGSALIDAAIGDHHLPTRLSVWDWREDAIRLYETRGFAPVASWEERPRLLCMERPAAPTTMPN